MYTRTAAFDLALVDSHNPVFVADVLSNGIPVDGAQNLPISGGNVDIDGTAAVRRRCKLTVIDVDGTLTPSSTSSPLAPYGREIRIKRGIRYDDGTTELLPIGVFRIASAVPIDDGDSREIQIDGFDRARAVSRYRFETPYVIVDGTNYATAISGLVTRAIPNVTLNLLTTSRTTPLIVFDQGGDPWESAQTLATSLGADLYFSPDGALVLTPTPDPSTQPVSWDYSKGSRATVQSVQNSLSDEPGYNTVVVDGEPPNGDPVHAVVYDLDNTSPTYALGPYGKVPYFYRSQYITTLAQATDAAAALLRANKGGTEIVKFTGIPHPALEVGDVVYVADADAGLPGANYVMESFTMPLGLALMNATTRKRRV